MTTRPPPIKSHRFIKHLLPIVSAIFASPFASRVVANVGTNSLSFLRSHQLQRATAKGNSQSPAGESSSIIVATQSVNSPSNLAEASFAATTPP
jgi:hypothetical protein